VKSIEPPISLWPSWYLEQVSQSLYQLARTSDSAKPLSAALLGYAAAAPAEPDWLFEAAADAEERSDLEAERLFGAAPQ
jgi:hypothetical protein